MWIQRGPRYILSYMTNHLGLLVEQLRKALSVAAGRVPPIVVLEGIDVAVGAHNLLDENFELAYGYPEQGRNYYAKLKAAF